MDVNNENVVPADHSYSAADAPGEQPSVKNELESEHRPETEIDSQKSVEETVSAEHSSSRSSTHHETPCSLKPMIDGEGKELNENDKDTSGSPPEVKTSRGTSERRAKIAAVTKLAIKKPPKFTTVLKSTAKKKGKGKKIQSFTCPKRISTGNTPHSKKGMVTELNVSKSITKPLMENGGGSEEVIGKECMEVQSEAPSSFLKPSKPQQMNLDDIVSSVEAEPNPRSTLLQLLNSDSKLRIFTGIPSFEVLDKLSDATLKMVLSSQQLISYMEPILRVWIIVTCSKLALNLSLEVVSIMFDIEPNDCTRIFKRTCHFLRKALVLPECQAYIPMIPLQVLSGIADCTDEQRSECVSGSGT